MATIASTRYLGPMIELSPPADPDALFADVYDELRRLARARLRRQPRATLLDTTVLVHEAYLRIAHARSLDPADRPRFFRYAARVMRSVIVDAARTRQAERHGGAAERVPLDSERDGGGGDGAREIVRVHEALEALAEHDPRLVQIVELRYFCGLTEAQVGEALGVTDRTVRRQWERARLLLAEALI
jgi:RNA polymerase sigma factor (TIGR02999 family)